MNDSLIFRQLFDEKTWTYTYLLGDSATGEACIIDPVLEKADRDLQLVRELGLRLTHVFDTHIHADHVTGSGLLRERTGALIAMSRAAAIAKPDILLEDGQSVSVGNISVKTILTPGHTDGCASFVVDDMAFTGDALLIRKTGRTDFQGGSAAQLYDSIHEKLYALPDSTRVFPGHDYAGLEMSTIGEEKRYNTRITSRTTQDEFVQAMAELKLEYPKYIDIALPANRKLGMVQR